MPRRTTEDFAAELDAHVQLEIDRLIAEGLSPRDARAAAIKAFGSPTRAREQFYERSRWVWLDQFVQDLRYAWRGLRAQPVFLVTTVLTLAVGLGLLTTAFSVFNAYVLRPFAVQDPDSLYRVAWMAPPDSGGQNFAWRDYDELTARSDLFTAAVGEDTHPVSSEGRTLAAAYVSDNYFSALGPRLMLGRGLTPADRMHPVAVLGHQAWARIFASDPGALGRTVDVDGQPYTVVGVMRPEFGGLDDYPRDIWMPAAERDSKREVQITVRLRADVVPAQAEARLAAFMSRKAPPKTVPTDVRAELRPNATANPFTWQLLAILSPVFAAFALVLATACVNVSNVMLARAIARQREIAVRLSLGAGRGRIVRQLLTEGLLISALAAASAIALAAWLLRAGTAALFSTLPPSLAALLRVAPMPVDVRVWGFAVLVAGAATLAFALVPALQASRQPLTDALRGQRSGTRGTSWLRSALVVAQVALSILLVVAALVLARNFAGVGDVDLGFQTDGVYSVNVRGEDGRPIVLAADALSADPRIAEVALTSGNPLFVTHTVAAAPAGDRAPVPVRYSFVSPEFFSVLRMPVLQGRLFLPDDARTSARVAVVSDATARAFWPGADPIGQTIRIERPTSSRFEEIEGYTQVTVVGTVRDVVSGMMVDGPDRARIYLPATAADRHILAALFRPRASSGFRVDMTREMFRRVTMDTERFEVIPMKDIRDAQMYPLRAGAWIGALLAGIALALSISGLYGVLSYMLAQRRREIGIRMALGATAAAVVSLVMRQSARLAAAGIAIGLGLAFAALKALDAVVRLREVTVLDPWSFAGAVLVVAGATALAAWQPSRRAARVDPAETLRAEA
jgi:putative ABC transport system permease protein